MNFKRFIIVVLLGALSVTSSIAYAQDVQQPDYKQEDIVTVQKDDVINKDFFGAGQVVEVNGTVNGDVYAAGGEVTINGTVNGDVLAAGGSVTIAQGAIVTQDVRAAGGRILIEGSVDKNVTAAGGSVLISNQALVKGSVTAAGGDINLEAPISKNIKIAAGSLALNNIVAGDADLAVKDLKLGDAARINGNLTYASEQELIFDERSVAGTVTHYTPPQIAHQPDQENRVNFLARTFFFIGLLGLVAKLLVGLLFIHLVPEFSRKAAMNLRTQPWKSLGTGFLIVVLPPILVIALMFTVIGVPIGFMLMMAYILALYISPILVMLAIGQVLARKFNQKWNDATALVVGLVVVVILRFIPIANILSFMLVTMLGIGVVFNTKREVYQELRKKNLI